MHVSGRLVTRDSIALSGTSLPLSALTEHLAPRSPGYVSLILDLVQGEDSEGDPEPSNLLHEAAQSLGAAERGYAVLAAMRPLTDATDRIAFTRAAMPSFDEDGPPSSEALLSAMHDRAAAGENGASAHTFVLLRGGRDATIDGLVAQAMEARDWRRVVELRLQRVETLTTATQRAQELTGIARIQLTELGDADGAIEVLERARAIDPKRAALLEALRYAYEASGRAPPIRSRRVRGGVRGALARAADGLGAPRRDAPRGGRRRGAPAPDPRRAVALRRAHAGPEAARRGGVGRPARSGLRRSGGLLADGRP